MRYLFFDIECCDGKHICEFGYVITDEEFNIIEKRCFPINPEAQFNLTAKDRGREIDLNFSEFYYKKAPSFPHFYKEIKELIEYPDQIIIGHSIINDAIFLRTACKRYKLAPINFKFADTQRMFKEYINIKDDVSLETAGEVLDVNDPLIWHKSDDDSKLSMHLVKEMCKQLECSLQELIDLCDDCTGFSLNNIIKYDDNDAKQLERYNKALSDTNNYMLNSNKRLFTSFIELVEPKQHIINPLLNGKVVCISSNYERTHFREMISLVQILKNNDASYSISSSHCDIFATYGNKVDKRLQCVRSFSSSSKFIEIITFDELLDLLNIKEEDLKNMEFPELKYFIKNEEPILIEESPLESSQHSQITLGDLFGDLLSKFNEDETENE